MNIPVVAGPPSSIGSVWADSSQGEDFSEKSLHARLSSDSLVVEERAYRERGNKDDCTSAIEEVDRG